MCWYYFSSKNIIRDVSYTQHGRIHRNLLDVYLPLGNHGSISEAAPCIDSSSRAPAPVLVFFSGGAWIIGHKLWSALIARGLSALGYVVIVPDYRNFPQGNIDAMVEDARAVLVWVYRHVGAYGGCATDMTVCGQSAGAHIVMTTILQMLQSASTCSLEAKPALQGDKPRCNGGEKCTTSEDTDTGIDSAPSAATAATAATSATSATAAAAAENPTSLELLRKIRNLILVNGPMDLVSLEAHCHDRGLDSRILRWICNDDLAAYSPTHMLQKFKLVRRKDTGPNYKASPRAIHLLPNVSILDCALDSSVPATQGQEFFDVLVDVGADVDVDVRVNGHFTYANKQHTSLVVEGPLLGNYTLCYDVDQIITANNKGARDEATMYVGDSAQADGAGMPKKISSSSSWMRSFQEDKVISGVETDTPSCSLYTGVQPGSDQLPSYVNSVSVAIAEYVSPF